MRVGVIAATVTVGAVLYAAPAYAEQTPSRWGEHGALTSGLYPLWEDTGLLMGAREFYLGTDEVGGGLGDALQLSINPDEYIHRAPNVAIKLRLVEGEDVTVAWRSTVLLLFQNAHTRFLTHNFTSRYANPRGDTMLFPNALSLSWHAAPLLRLHASTTLLPMLTMRKKHRSLHVAAGASVMGELAFVTGASLILHLGEVGLWQHDFYYFAASVRLNYAWAVMHVGYGYRVYPDGVQSSPMLSVGVAL